jgi:hypothetical protein
MDDEPFFSYERDNRSNQIKEEEAAGPTAARWT